MTWLGVWRFAFTCSSSSPTIAGQKNSHIRRTNPRGSGHAVGGDVEHVVWAVTPAVVEVPLQILCGANEAVMDLDALAVLGKEIEDGLGAARIGRILMPIGLEREDTKRHREQIVS